MLNKNLLVCLLLAAIVLAGCGNYYEVKDITTGKLYYTKDIDYKKGEAVKFEDEITDSEVILNSANVREISHDEYEAAVKCPPQYKHNNCR